MPATALEATRAGRETTHSRTGFIVACSVLVPMLAVTIWWSSRDHETPIIAPLVTAEEKPITAVEGVTLAALPAAPTEVLKSFFGVPVNGRVVGFVLDHDTSMSRYMDGVGFVACATTTAMEPDKQRFAIAVAQDGAPMVVRPSRVEASAIAAARSRLFGTFPSEKTDLSAAVVAATDWQPEQLFLIFSNVLTRPQTESLVQRARQTGAVVHVLALGAARSEGLAGQAIADATGGRFLAVDDATFDRTVNDVSLAIVALSGKLEKEARR